MHSFYATKFASKQQKKKNSNALNCPELHQKKCRIVTTNLFYIKTLDVIS